MATLTHSFKNKHTVSIKGNMKLTKYQLPNGNIATVICGKSKNMNVVCTIVTSDKKTTHKSGKSISKVGAKCSRK